MNLTIETAPKRRYLFPQVRLADLGAERDFLRSNEQIVDDEEELEW